MVPRSIMGKIWRREEEVRHLRCQAIWHSLCGIWREAGVRNEREPSGVEREKAGAREDPNAQRDRLASCGRNDAILKREILVPLTFDYQIMKHLIFSLKLKFLPVMSCWGKEMVETWSQLKEEPVSLMISHSSDSWSISVAAEIGAQTITMGRVT